MKVIKNKITDTASILLYDSIGKEPDGTGISGAEVAKQIYDLEKEGYKKIKMRINSGGGSVMDGYSIFSAIQNSKIKIDTYNDGVAASIAGVILMAGRKVFAQDYSLTMLHNPSMEGSSDKDNEIINKFKNSLMQIFNNKTGIPMEQLDEIMNVETWYDATTAKDKGFIDEIITTGKKIEVDQNQGFNVQAIYNKAKIIIKQKSMENILNKLKLNNEAGEAEVILAIENIEQKETELKSENEILKAELEKLNAELAELKSEKEKAFETEVEKYIDNAIADSKIKADAKANWVKLAKSDFEAVKNSLESISSVKQAVKISAATYKAPANVAISNERATWTFNDWRKKDSEGLAKMQNETPELYQSLFDKQFKKVA